ncbi:MAG: haloacid dehalogenase type II [Acidobacteria bacterium]|nr:haloacid dehalogenase type II [Acidobacteriota bacterium]
MQTGRRAFVRAVGAAAAGAAGAAASGKAASSAGGSTSAAAGPETTAPLVQPAGGAEGIEAFAFDAYGTLFDVFSVTALCEELFPGSGDALSQRWRAKQLQYSLLRSLMGRHRDFWVVTGDALVYAARSLGLDLTPARRERLMDAYLSLAAFPDVRPGLEALRDRGLRLAILSNGEPRMLEAAARSAGIDTLLDTIISVEEVKIFKVSPRVYNLGVERLGVDRSALGFVSSNAWDVAGAASAGLITCWIQRAAAEPPDELGFEAHRVVAAITDLAPLVDG